MLSEGQCPQGAVECPPGTSDLALVHEELTVVQPDPRHLRQHSITIIILVYTGIHVQCTLYNVYVHVHA